MATSITPRYSYIDCTIEDEFMDEFYEELEETDGVEFEVSLDSDGWRFIRIEDGIREDVSHLVPAAVREAISLYTHFEWSVDAIVDIYGDGSRLERENVFCHAGLSDGQWFAKNHDWINALAGYGVEAHWSLYEACRDADVIDVDTVWPPAGVYTPVENTSYEAPVAGVAA